MITLQCYKMDRRFNDNCNLYTKEFENIEQAVKYVKTLDLSKFYGDCFAFWDSNDEDTTKQHFIDFETLEVHY